MPTAFGSSITATIAQMAAAFRAGDAAAVAACYTTSCLLTPPGIEMIAGRAGVQAYWKGLIDLGATALTMETSELAEQGQSAVELGDYTVVFGAGQVLDHGKYYGGLAAGRWRVASKPRYLE